MDGQSKKGFVLAIILHLAVAVSLVLVAFIKPEEKQQPAVFTLMAPPPAAEFSSETAPQFEIPEVAPPRPEPPPPRVVETPPPPRPQPRPTPTPRPAPRPAEAPKPKPPEPKPQPVPPPPATISLDEFREKFGEPKQRPVRPAQPRPVNVPRIDTKFSANIREAVIDLDAVVSLSDADLAALDRYIALLKEALRRSWNKPVGLAQTTEAVVEFDVQPNGRLTNVRLARTSGNVVFDESVRGAFTRLGSTGATPDGRAKQLSLTFRMRDQ